MKLRSTHYGLSFLSLTLLVAACGGGVGANDAGPDAQTLDVTSVDAQPDTNVTPDAAAPDALVPDVVSVPDVALPDVLPPQDAMPPADVLPPPDATAPDAAPETSVDSGADAGGPCTDNSACTSRQYCAGTGCGTPGVCSNRPVACAPTDAPVCGCDGTNYADLCQAHLVGVRVASTGVCAGTDAGHDAASDATSDAAHDAQALPDGGCITNADCPGTGMFCQLVSGAACGSVGTCAPRPTTCAGFCILQCACDNNSYCNPCLANRAGTNIAHAGSCGGGI